MADSRSFAFLRSGLAALLIITFATSPLSLLAETAGNSSTQRANDDAATPSGSGSAAPDGGVQSLSFSEPDDPTASFIREGGAYGRVIDPSSGSYTGAYTYQVPLKVPPGRNGMTPDLTLTYSSQSHADTSIFGYGWSISIPYIERFNKAGFGNLYSTTSTSTSFYSSLSGELATTSNPTQFVARNDDGSYLKYAFSNNVWTVTDKNGKTFLFGTSTAGRQDDPTNSSTIFKWMLQQIIDANGNTITYSYSKDAGQIYPSSITYTGTATTTGIFSVAFSKSLRATSTATTTDTGFAVKTRYKIDQITAAFNGGAVHKYDLAYGTGDNHSRLLLSSVTETGQAEASSTTLALPPTTFAYSTSTSAMATSSWSLPTYGRVVDNGTDRGVNVADVNGDGLADLVQAFMAYDGSTYQHYEHIYVNTGSSWALDNGWTVPCDFTFTSVSGHYLNDGGGRLIDVNGDGRSDFVCNTSVYLNNGHTWASSTWSLPVGVQSNGYELGVRFGDINGDGLVDVIKSYDTISGTHTYTQSVYFNNGQGWTYDASWTIPSTSILFGDSEHNAQYGQVADINADGLADLVAGNGSVFVNTGSGWANDGAWGLPTNPSNPGVRMADINGDGLVDVLEAKGTVPPYPNEPIFSWNTNSVWLNTGSGWTRDYTRFVPAPLAVNEEDFGGRFADINGDGISDQLVSGVLNLGGDFILDNQYLSQGAQPDLLTTIVESSGRTITASYKTTPQYRDISGSLMNPLMALTMTTLRSLSFYDGVASTTAETYEYRGGSLYYANPFDRRLAGFASIRKTDALGNVLSSYFHQGTGQTGGIVYQNSAHAGSIVGTSLSFTPASCSGANTYALVQVLGDVSTDNVSGVTYGSSTMSLIDKVGLPDGQEVYLFGLTNPPSGSQTVTVHGSPVGTLAANEICYSGVKQTGQPEAVNVITPGYTWTINGSVTTQSAGALVVSTTFASYDGGNGNPSNAVARIANYDGNFLDSNMPVDDPSTYTLSMGLGALERALSITVSLAPADTSLGWGEYQDDQSKIGKIYRTEQYSGSTTLYSLILNRWESATSGRANFVKQTQTVSLDYDGNSTHRDKAETYAYDDSGHNLIQKIQWGEVNGSLNGGFTDIGSDRLTTGLSYAASSTGYLVAPSTSSTTDQSGTKISETKTYFDGLSLGSVSKGNPTKTEQ